jgi:hypothetical protein
VSGQDGAGRGSGPERWVCVVLVGAGTGLHAGDGHGDAVRARLEGMSLVEELWRGSPRGLVWTARNRHEAWANEAGDADGPPVARVLCLRLSAPQDFGAGGDTL